MKAKTTGKKEILANAPFILKPLNDVGDLKLHLPSKVYSVISPRVAAAPTTTGFGGAGAMSRAKRGSKGSKSSGDTVQLHTAAGNVNSKANGSKNANNSNQYLSGARKAALSKTLNSIAALEKILQRANHNGLTKTATANLASITSSPLMLKLLAGGGGGGGGVGDFPTTTVFPLPTIPRINNNNHNSTSVQNQTTAGPKNDQPVGMGHRKRTNSNNSDLDTAPPNTRAGAKASAAVRRRDSALLSNRSTAKPPATAASGVKRKPLVDTSTPAKPQQQRQSSALPQLPNNAKNTNNVAVAKETVAKQKAAVVASNDDKLSDDSLPAKVPQIFLRRQPSAKTWKSWRNADDSYAYSDVQAYIDENELMSADKRAHIVRWIADVRSSQDAPRPRTGKTNNKPVADR